MQTKLLSYALIVAVWRRSVTMAPPLGDPCDDQQNLTCCFCGRVEQDRVSAAGGGGDRFRLRFLRRRGRIQRKLSFSCERNMQQEALAVRRTHVQGTGSQRSLSAIARAYLPPKQTRCRNAHAARWRIRWRRFDEKQLRGWKRDSWCGAAVHLRSQMRPTCSTAASILTRSRATVWLRHTVRALRRFLLPLLSPLRAAAVARFSPLPASKDARFADQSSARPASSARSALSHGGIQ